MSFYEMMADADEARNVGMIRSDCAWICTNRDVWHRNPFYTGLEQPHPEDDGAHEFIAEYGIEVWREQQKEWRNQQTSPKIINDSFDDCPF